LKKIFPAMFLGLFLTVVQVAQADVVQANFTELNGLPVASVGQIVFSLNSNGTIAASLTTSLSSYQGFAFNAPIYETQSDFSDPYAISSGWGTYQYGVFQSGFVCNDGNATVNCVNNLVGPMTWTIGNVGEFTSVENVLDGASSYDFYLMNWPAGAGTPNEWVADVSATVPEPKTLLLFLLGLVYILGLRRKTDWRSL